MTAVDSFFSAYVDYLTEYDHQSLLHFMDCLDSLEIELQKKYDTTLQIFPEYVPLDAIRNYWHNHEDIKNHFVLSQAPEMPGVHTDLPFLCLLDDNTMEKVIESIDEEYREDDGLTIYETVHFYGNIVNIGHIIFNITSHIMSKLLELGIEGTSKKYEIARESIRCYPDNSKPITFSGWFEGDPGLVCSVITQIYEKALDDLLFNLERLDNQEVFIETIIDEPTIKALEVEAAFLRAQEIFDQAPYLLNYQGQEWTCSPERIGNWLVFRQKDGQAREALFLDQEKIKEYLEEISKELNVDPIETRLEVVENEGQRRVSEFQAGKKGLRLDIEATQDLITQTILLGEEKNIPLQIEEIDPTPLPDDLNVLGINDLLAVGVSNFAGSPQNRRHNIKVGAQILHGLLISPDQEFSLVQALGRIDKDAGFLPELVIKGDRTVLEYGGGLCQIGTTMFRLALNAGLPITERASHSYRVSYYEPAGLDATIYNPRPDFRFVNDTGHHLLLQTEIDGDALVFEFYGTKDGRKVKGEGPEIYNVVQPGPPQFIETDELNPGEKKRIESAHAGAEAKYINTIIFPNGITRKDIWVSRYQPWPEVWLVGRELEEEADDKNSISDSLD